MIDTKHLRTVVVQGLKEYTDVPVTRSNQNKKPSEYPYISYTITTPESENKGTFGVYEDGIDRKPTEQTWSISCLSDDEDVCLDLASKARDWFESVGRIYLKSNGVVIKSITGVTSRDNILTAEYEYKKGFDVVFYLMNEVENYAVATGEYIESADIGNITVSQEDVNSIGIENLAKHGVIVDENASTKEIMQSISKIVSGDSICNELETLIDNSRVLEDTEGTVTEKVEELIEKAEELDIFNYITRGNQLFYGAETFPSKAVVNLPNVKNIYQAFAYWNKEPIPIVEELTVTAPNIWCENNQSCMGQMFHYNNGVKKVVLNMPNESEYMESTFSLASILEEVVLNFSTKNIIRYFKTFSCKKLKRIVGVLDFSSATAVTSTFDYCNSLEEVTFAPNTLSISISLAWSSKLSAESIQSIIDGLATVETQQKLTLHTNAVLKLTQEQLTTIANKNWTVG